MSKLKKLQKNPPLLIVLSFLSVIFIGAFLLNLPIASQNNESIGMIDALFTATSATCVTGLTVANTASQWTFFGKLVILLLIQIGGLGTMVVISLFFIALGRRINLSQRILIKEQLSSLSMKGIVRLTKYVISFSLLIELIGASFLAFRFIPLLGWQKGMIYSVFHAISAFCNAGFDLFGNSLEGFQKDYLVVLVISFLIIFGGLGFTVFLDIYNKKNFRNFTLHTKVVLSITGMLLLIGGMGFFILECTREPMAGFNFGEKLLNSFFMSVTTRTAGFNTMDLSKLSGPSVLLAILLMFIGASPASTGGGLKTTTFGVLLFSTVSILRGNRETVIFKRRIPLETILKSLCIFFLGSAIVISVSMGITLIEGENFQFLDILFETVSAFGTVGVTRGITIHLHDLSKMIIVIVMFMGRIGPTTLVIALIQQKTARYTKYAEGKIIVG
ncbi:MAG: TrkH family potassium uptake protein [Tissierellia bacterium]|nr:TrkH family potassium uptake protein [Tissierellia bacterium]